MNTFLFLLKLLAGKIIKDNLPNLNRKNLWRMLLDSDPLTVTVRSVQALIAGLVFIVVNQVENFGLPALAEPGVVEFSAKILTCLAFTEVTYLIFQLVIKQLVPGVEKGE